MIRFYGDGMFVSYGNLLPALRGQMGGNEQADADCKAGRFNGHGFKFDGLDHAGSF